MSPETTADGGRAGRGRGTISRWSIEHPYIVIAFQMATGTAGSRRAARKLTYVNPGVSDAERKRDENECVRTALDHVYRVHILIPVALDRDAFRSCLEARGYTEGRGQLSLL